MKHILSFLLLFFVINTCAGQWGRYKKVRGDGNIQTQERRGEDFSDIKACCSMQVMVTKGNTYSISVETDANLQEYILTEVSGDRLVIKKADRVNLDPSEKIKVYVTTPSLTALKSSSSSSLICSGSFEGRDLELDVSSSGKIVVDFTGESVDIESSSSGKIELTGKAERLRFDGSSSSRVDAGKFVVNRVNAEASSSSRLIVDVKDELDADVSSSGKVFYKGNPDKLYTDASSGGKVAKY